jgi:glycosyltransferase involved in cell wall biosynthesis
MPKVSVIIPNYNHADYLCRRIESVLSQTFKDFEVIFLDDASTDESAKLVNRYINDSRIAKCIFNKTNTGNVFMQWDRGIQEAKGDYIWIAETDDYADTGLLKELVSILDSHPSVGLAYCKSYRVDGQNARDFFSHSFDYIEKGRWNKDFINNGRDEIGNYLILGCTIPNASAVLFRKDLYHKVGGVDAGMKQCADYLLWVKMLLVSDIAFYSKPLNYFRFSKKSVRESSAKEGLSLYEQLAVLTFIKNNVPVAKDKIRRAFYDFFRSWVHNANVYRFPVRTHPLIYNQLKYFTPDRFLFLKVLVLFFITEIRYIVRLRTRIGLLKKSLFVKKTDKENNH